MPTALDVLRTRVTVYKDSLLWDTHKPFQLPAETLASLHVATFMVLDEKFYEGLLTISNRYPDCVYFYVEP